MIASVLDLSMPQMSGEEAPPELRRIRPAVRIVVSSGYSAVDGLIQKPYTSTGIAEKVKACLG